MGLQKVDETHAQSLKAGSINLHGTNRWFEGCCGYPVLRCALPRLEEALDVLELTNPATNRERNR